MPSFAPARWLFHRARIRYKPLVNAIEMADRSVIPVNAHEEEREEPYNRNGAFEHDLAGGDLDSGFAAQKQLPTYRQEREASTSTLDGAVAESDDQISEHDLATLRRVSDKIPISAW